MRMFECKVEVIGNAKFDQTIVHSIYCTNTRDYTTLVARFR
jgi:hypothetical protein